MIATVACDVLVVATEPAFHAELIALGIRSGVHVVCEKPLAVTRADYATVAGATALRPDLALVPVHQYRYSPEWPLLARGMRAAIMMRRQYALTVDVNRLGTDRFASVPWRADIAATGGMLADAGVHFLALAWNVHRQLRLLTVERHMDGSGHELSTATYRLGTGTVTLKVTDSANERSTQLQLRVGALAIRWRDDDAQMLVGQRTVHRRRVQALSDRDHVDALYKPLYADVAHRLGQRRWRTRRTLEALCVGEALINTLENAPTAV